MVVEEVRHAVPVFAGLAFAANQVPRSSTIHRSSNHVDRGEEGQKLESNGCGLGKRDSGGGSPSWSMLFSQLCQGQHLCRHRINSVNYNAGKCGARSCRESVRRWCV